MPKKAIDLNYFIEVSNAKGRADSLKTSNGMGTELGASLQVEGAKKLAETYELLNQVINQYAAQAVYDTQRFRTQGNNDVLFDKNYRTK